MVFKIKKFHWNRFTKESKMITYFYDFPCLFIVSLIDYEIMSSKPILYCRLINKWKNRTKKYCRYLNYWNIQLFQGMWLFVQNGLYQCTIQMLCFPSGKAPGQKDGIWPWPSSKNAASSDPIRQHPRGYVMRHPQLIRSYPRDTLLNGVGCVGNGNLRGAGI